MGRSDPPPPRRDWQGGRGVWPGAPPAEGWRPARVPSHCSGLFHACFGGEDLAVSRTKESSREEGHRRKESFRLSNLASPLNRYFRSFVQGAGAANSETRGGVLKSKTSERK